MKINKAWHLKNKMPANPTMDQRIHWHMEHLKHCSCRRLTPKLEEEFKKRGISVHNQDSP